MGRQIFKYVYSVIVLLLSGIYMFASFNNPPVFLAMPLIFASYIMLTYIDVTTYLFVHKYKVAYEFNPINRTLKGFIAMCIVGYSLLTLTTITVIYDPRGVFIALTFFLLILPDFINDLIEGAKIIVNEFI